MVHTYEFNFAYSLITLAHETLRFTHQLAVKSTTTKRIPAAASSDWKCPSLSIARTLILANFHLKTMNFSRKITKNGLFPNFKDGL